MNFKPLVIGNLFAKIPMIQGGMGVGVSLSQLAGAVACEGGIGIISSAQIGYQQDNFMQNPLKANLEGLSKHIALAKEKAKGGIIGVNIMTALRNYEEYVKCCCENKADIIISGAGVPINLPNLVKNTTTKIAPIVSSVKAVAVLLKMWDRRYGATADAVVVEGPKAGGHLGFKAENLENDIDFDDELKGIIDFVKTYEEKFEKHIPVVFAGGVFSKEDVERFMEMGCEGVQVASRFVTTEECDAHINFKNAYINAKKEDIGIVKSPVGMPGRAIMNDFIERTKIKNDDIAHCYGCLSHCDRQTIPYCITKSLVAAAEGDVDNGLVFCGANAYKQNKITTVREVIADLMN